MSVLAIPATNSRNGLNRQVIGYAANVLSDVGVEVEVVDINDYEMPIYSPERQENGIPELAQTLFDKMGSADAIVLSFAEHNGTYTAAWKNIHDWMSRIDMAIYQGKKVAMCATSPGGRGGVGVLEGAKATASFFGAELVGTLSIPSFHDNFDTESGTISDPELNSQFVALLEQLK